MDLQQHVQLHSCFFMLAVKGAALWFNLIDKADVSNADWLSVQVSEESPQLMYLGNV